MNLPATVNPLAFTSSSFIDTSIKNGMQLFSTTTKTRKMRNIKPDNDLELTDNHCRIKIIRIEAYRKPL